MALTEVKKGVWKEPSAIYGKAKTFQIKCAACGKTDTVEMTIVEYARIHIVCVNCGSDEKIFR
jgi:Zn ribbon nucleic-acid-binding protein